MNKTQRQGGPYRTLASIEEQEGLGNGEVSKAPSIYEMAKMLAVSYEPEQKSRFARFLNFIVSYTVFLSEKTDQLKVGPVCARLEKYDTLRLLDERIPDNHIFKKSKLYGRIKAKLAYFKQNENTLKEAASHEEKMIQAFLAS